MFSVGLHEPGPRPGPSQGSQLYCDLHLTEDTQVSKSPEGLKSQVLLQINIAKHSKGIRIHFVSDFFFFLLIEIIYFICVQSFLWSVVFCMIVWGENDSYCRLYIYEFVNSKNGIVGILCGNAQFYLLRMKIKAQVKGYMLAVLAGSFVGYCMILLWFHPVLLPDLTLWYL